MVSRALYFKLQTRRAAVMLLIALRECCGANAEVRFGKFYGVSRSFRKFMPRGIPIERFAILDDLPRDLGFLPDLGFWQHLGLFLGLSDTSGDTVAGYPPPPLSHGLQLRYIYTYTY